MERALVLYGPGLDLTQRCQPWATEVGLEVETRRCPDQASLVDALRSVGGVDGIVLVPGLEGFASATLAAAVADTRAPVVAVSLGNLRRRGIDPAGSTLGSVAARVIHGRGAEGCRWALHHLVWRAAWPFHSLPYGEGPDQIADLRVPDREPDRDRPFPVAVLVHGGFWYDPWERDLMEGLAIDLAHRGVAVWNVEYRRVGGGGGWPATAHDVAAAVDHLSPLARPYRLDTGRVALVGHSAGGQLALWTASRRTADVRPRLVVALAAVTDLAVTRNHDLGGRAVAALLATAPDPQRARVDASPIARLPLGLAQLVAHAADDPLVPVDQSRRYVITAQAAGDEVDYREFTRGGHFALITPHSPAWRTVAKALTETLCS
jgi:acetyl esterase/lipase